jgi:hypothetical protein
MMQVESKLGPKSKKNKQAWADAHTIYFIFLRFHSRYVLVRLKNRQLYDEKRGATYVVGLLPLVYTVVSLDAIVMGD